MKIKNYLISLLPNFEKGTVLEDLRLTRDEIKDVAMPAYASGSHFLKGWKFKSKEVSDLFIIFDRILKRAGNDNMYVTIEKAFPTILSNLEEVEMLIEKTYNEDMAGIGLTYMKANLLQFVEAAGFVSKFARRFLLYTYIHETGKYEQGGTSVTESLTPLEQQWIEQNFLTFCMSLRAVSGNPGNFKKSLNDVPDIIATVDNADTLAKTISGGEERLDPLEMRFIPVWLNPIYHIRMRIAEWQTARYKNAREELTVLQLRKINLEQVAEGKPDASVQKKINYLEKRIQDQAYKLNQMEKAHA